MGVRRELGNFPTPLDLAAEVLGALGPIGTRWPRVLVPSGVADDRAVVQSIGGPALRLDGGTDDFLLNWNRTFHRHLEVLQVSHEYQALPGGHDWGYWDQHVPEAIAFLTRNPQLKHSRSSITSRQQESGGHDGPPHWRCLVFGPMGRVTLPSGNTPEEEAPELCCVNSRCRTWR
jgi:hypothetical protein